MWQSNPAEPRPKGCDVQQAHVLLTWRKHTAATAVSTLASPLQGGDGSEAEATLRAQNEGGSSGEPCTPEGNTLLFCRRHSLPSPQYQPGPRLQAFFLLLFLLVHPPPSPPLLIYPPYSSSPSPPFPAPAHFSSPPHPFPTLPPPHPFHLPLPPPSSSSSFCLFPSSSTMGLLFFFPLLPSSLPPLFSSFLYLTHISCVPTSHRIGFCSHCSIHYIYDGFKVFQSSIGFN